MREPVLGSSGETDDAIRAAAFEHLRGMQALYGRLTWAQIDAGFLFRGEVVRFASRPRGIFRPRQMLSVLSIKTVLPKAGRRLWYEDQRQAHEQIFAGGELVEYAFSGEDPNDPDNRGLLNAQRNQTPLIYFLGVAPSIYQVVMPVFVADWDAAARRVRLSFGTEPVSTAHPPSNPFERRYALSAVKRRLHQAMFRETVIAAYGARCALSGLPEQRLLDAAHIIPDREELGRPLVQNGFPLSKIHHAAFDAHLIGIDADGKVHVAPSLRAQNDGPILEAMKALHGRQIRPPLHKQDAPSRDLLAYRFDQYERAT